MSDRARVLIVDDERDIVDLLQDILVELGYDVRPVFVSSDAVAVAVAFRPEVILLDIAMSGMMGAQVLEALRAAGVRAPVIAISARSASRPASTRSPGRWPRRSGTIGAAMVDGPTAGRPLRV